jgi:ribosomal protein L7/L12
MSIRALVCPQCAAPLAAGPPAVTKCVYCGATLVAEPAPGTLRVVTVWLDDAGPDKKAVIQAVFRHLRIGLKASLDLVDSAPCVLAANIAESLAQGLVVELGQLGATVRMGAA